MYKTTQINDCLKTVSFSCYWTSSGASGGWIRTIELEITSQLFCHCVTHFSGTFIDGFFHFQSLLFISALNCLVFKMKQLKFFFFIRSKKKKNSKKFET